MLCKNEVPEPRLDRRMRLGLTSWVGRGGKARGGEHRPPTDRDDLKLRPNSSFLLRRLGAAKHPATSTDKQGGRHG